ncbi:MAG: neutral/alkaline non-lysosomal ceramidase N-terminal domain-containing protein [Opitutus sp.]
MISPTCLLLLVAALAAPSQIPLHAGSAAPLVMVGSARVDITPELPIRLSGYGARQAEATRVEMPLFARALAIGAENPVVLITVEVVGISESLGDAVAAALREQHGIPRAKVAIAVTHVHTGPSLAGVLPNLFSADLPSDEVARIDAYTERLRGLLIEVANSALAVRKPGALSWAEGTVGFATQRRQIVDGKWTGFTHSPDGPVDHSLPVLRVTDERGGVRAVLLNYACHCTTLQAADNYVHSDWAGDAARRIESAHPGSVALVAIGCGADGNPNPRGSADLVTAHGGKIAGEVERLLAQEWRSLGPVTAAAYKRIELAFERTPTREELVARTGGEQKQSIRYAASKFLERLDAGQPLPRGVTYPIQTWIFGGNLAMVFLSGEVVSEYSLRLRSELDGARLWVNAYSNSVPCYVASKRMFSEGGYEVDGSMDYYGWPGRLALGTEDQIIRTVHEMIPPSFRRRSAH